LKPEAGLTKHLNRKNNFKINVCDLINNGKILITGGSGVLGSYVAELLKEEFDIVVADIERPQIEDVKFVRLDCLKPFSLGDEFEVIIHLAAFVGGIQFFTKHPVENIRDNPRMTANVFDAAVKSKVRHVIFTSSSVVYQYQTEFPYTEESVYRSPPPSSAYGLSKLVGEHLCKAYNEQFGIKYTVLRPFNIYGPKEAPDPEYAHVIPELIRKVLSGQFPVDIFGTGNQTRTFTYGLDAARAYLLSIINKNAVNETFNVSGNNEIKIIEVLKLIWEMTNHTSELRVNNLPPFPHDVERRFPSNEKIKEKLGWKPYIPFEEGLFETIRWVRKKMGLTKDIE
jgi:UDP-glucose 4-epimerase